MSEPGKVGSVRVRLFSALGLAFALIAIPASLVSFLEGFALVLSVPAVLLGAGALALGWAKDASLLLPTLTLVLAVVPAAKDNWRSMRTVWVESVEICNPPGMQGHSLMALVGSAAIAADHENQVGNHICFQLGKRFADHFCDGGVGRIKCEP